MNAGYIFRPVREADVEALVNLARSTGGGLTTLPPDREFLESKVHDSLSAFGPRVKKPGGEYYLFVIENCGSGEIVATSGISARVGGFEPWYSYQIVTEHHVHEPLGVDRSMQLLQLKKEHRGPSEVCSLFLRKDCRGGSLGRLLSLSRFLFMAAFPMRFTPTVIAEMRGFSNEEGKSPFWEAVGRHFVQKDYYAADVLSGLGEKGFISDLMPRHPLYVDLLPREAREVLGRVHRDTEAALALLRSEGFTSMGEVDIFDAGPLVHASLHEVRTVRMAFTAKIEEVTEANTPEGRPGFLLANGRLDFRACLGNPAGIDPGTVRISRTVADALDLEEGDQLWVSPLR
jgi:arginine N-succinyltransferase